MVFSRYMTRRPQDHLTIYRRHIKNCPAKGLKGLDGCQCPFYMHGTLAGDTRVRECLNTRSHSEAVRKRDQCLDRGTLEEPTAGPSLVTPIGQGGVTVEEAIPAYISFGTRKEVTRKTYRENLIPFRDWLAAREVTLLRQVDSTHIDRYLKTRNWEDNTKRAALDIFRQLFRWCHQSRHWIPYSPAADKGLSIA